MLANTRRQSCAHTCWKCDSIAISVHLFPLSLSLYWMNGALNAHRALVAPIFFLFRSISLAIPHIDYFICSHYPSQNGLCAQRWVAKLFAHSISGMFFLSLQQKWTVKSTTYELVGTIYILLITEKVNTKAKAKWNNTIKTVANNKKRKRRISKYKHIVAAAASFVIIILVFLSFNLLLWNDD